MDRERCIYLVRHGETEGESSIRYHGRNDVPLSNLGRLQAVGITPHIRHVQFSALVHSPLSRAFEAAEILQACLARPPAVVEMAPDLVEVDFGDMEGMTQVEIGASMPDWYSDWVGGRATGFPGGESFAGFADRIGLAFDGLLARHPEGNLLVVAHKGVIKRGLGRLLDLPADAVKKLDPALGSLSVVSCGETMRLKHWNLLPETP